MEMSSNNNKQWEFIKQMFEELVKYQSKQNKRISELEEFMNEIRALLAEE